MLQFSKKTLEVNEQQYKAITRPIDVHQRIIASAGSGKTTTLTARIAYLIEYHNVKSNQIVLLTFSRNSATQMKKKLHDLIGEERSHQVWAGTFHGLAKNLLQKYSPKSTQTLYFVDELVIMGEKWLKTTDGRKWVSKLRYIFVDEFQDINNSQWNMIMRMLRPGAYLIVVGDDCQNIYTWRGSNVNFILNLDKELRNLVDDQLNINYRSSENIINVANAIMKHIPTLPWKHTMISYQPKHLNPHVHFFYRVIDETNWIIKDIQKQFKNNPNVSIAIISRMNIDLYRFEEECILKNISYRLFDVGIEEKFNNNSNSIDLVTVHSSKGLEWDIVYLIHMNDDVFPSSKKKHDIVHERRLFYVAVTRARRELYVSYTSDERNLSRFIREIPNTMLLYHGIAKYMLSEFELGKSRKRLIDLLGSLTTEDITKLRNEGMLDWFNTNKLVVSSLYPIDLYWKKPSWITNETLPDFQRFLNIWLKRHFCSISSLSYRDPASEKLIFTLRIFSEDFDFWNNNKEYIRNLVDKYFGNLPKGQDIPNVDYKMIEEYSENNDIFWSPKEIVSATSIMGKIRGQLRPLRFYNYNIQEFNIGLSRFVVPIQWRGEILESWRKVVNPTVHWKDCLIDIWKIGALGLVAEGRNVAMYRSQSMRKHLDSEDFKEFLESVERYTSIWFSEKNLIGTSIYIESNSGITDSFDIQLDNALYNIGGIRFDSTDLLRLAIGSSFLEDPTEDIGIFIPLDGKLFTLKLPPNIKDIANYILAMALSKTT
jgi:AAA domain/UvrD-like helicase C-terminal domain